MASPNLLALGNEKKSNFSFAFLSFFRNFARNYVNQRMKDDVKVAVRNVLSNYLEQNKRRKTPERFAVLDAIFEFPSYFSLQDLNDKLEASHFPVSRATLYNTINLFMELRLVLSHRMGGETRYEAAYDSVGHCRQICTVCGKTTAVKSPAIIQAVNETRLKRFRRDGFSLYIYGVCSSCQAKMTRQKNKKKQ